jgi:predicted LPLAT superfamily acyltransferase
MSEWDGQSRGNVLGYRIFIFILRYIHISVAYFVVRFVAFYFYFSIQKKNISTFYSDILGYSKLKTKTAIYANFLQFGKALIDKVVILSGFKGNFTFDYDGEEYLHQMAARGAGGIILGAHAGNWEIAGHLLQRINKPVHVVMYDGERSNIKEVLEEVSGHRSFNTITIHDNDMAHIYQINEVLARGELIAMHGDRYREEGRTLTVKFFGRDAKFPVGPYYLAAQCNVPICFVHTMKEGPKHYHFYSTPPMLVEGNSRKERETNIRQSIQRYAAGLEEMVKKYPQQWYNYYDFWKT